jgi:hypothetical protein
MLLLRNGSYSLVCSYASANLRVQTAAQLLLKRREKIASKCLMAVQFTESADRWNLLQDKAIFVKICHL